MRFWITSLCLLPFRVLRCLPRALLDTVHPRNYEDYGAVIFAPLAWPLLLVDLLLQQIWFDFCVFRGTREKHLASRARSAAAESAAYLGEALLFRRGSTLPVCDRTSRPVSSGNPLTLPWKKATSVLMLGSPGTGKTTGALSLACGEIASNAAAEVVYIDCKGDDPETFRTLQHYASKHNLPFFYLSTEAEPSHATNPIKLLADTVEWRSTFSTMLTRALGVGAGLPHTFYVGESASFIDDLLTLYPDADTFASMKAA